jgi:hypothetical protein
MCQVKKVFKRKIKRDVVLRADPLVFNNHAVLPDYNEPIISCHEIILRKYNVMDEVNRLNDVQKRQGNAGTMCYCALRNVDCYVYSLEYIDEDIGERNSFYFGKRGMALLCFENPQVFFNQKPQKYLEKGDLDGLTKIIHNHIHIMRLVIAPNGVLGIKNDGIEAHLSLGINEYYYITLPTIIY